MTLWGAALLFHLFAFAALLLFRMRQRRAALIFGLLGFSCLLYAAATLLVVMSVR